MVALFERVWSSVAMSDLFPQAVVVPRVGHLEGDGAVVPDGFKPKGVFVRHSTLRFQMPMTKPSMKPVSDFSR